MSLCALSIKKEATIGICSSRSNGSNNNSKRRVAVFVQEASRCCTLHACDAKHDKLIKQKDQDKLISCSTMDQYPNKLDQNGTTSVLAPHPI